MATTVGKRYYVRLPIIDDPANIPSNYKMAYARLHSNYAELSKNPGLLQKYDQIFQDQLDAGIIEEVPRDEFQTEFRTHYLPHQGVIKESSATTKLRMVLDGSSHTHGMGSINDNLHRGPVLVPDLLGVLLRTRLPSILISGDLEKAFHSVGLHKDDRDFTRLLWVKDTTLPPSQSNLRIFRFARVPFGLNSSPFLLSGTLLHHMDSNPSEYVDVVRRMIYVDNVFMGAESEEECRKIYNDLRHLFSSASMNIREFFSNSANFNEFVQEHGTGVEDLSKAKVLGINWDPVSDGYSLARVARPSDSTIWTKRKALRYSALYWDILGIVAPVTMQLKRFIQLLWKDSYTWDQPLSADHSSTLWKLIDQFESIDNISIPRMAIPRPIDGALIELHCFCDASAAAYCSVIYLVVRRADGSGVSHFLTSKVRISPKDPVPIPRLELLGNLMGALLTATVIRELDLRIDQIFVWTDSSICLHWITQPKANLPVFIRNRIKQIREALPTTTEFLHIDGKMNPADIGSRGCSAQELIDSVIWWHGPSFLTSHRSKWPVKNLLPVKTDVTLLIPSTTMDSSSLPIPVENFSSWTRLLHVTVDSSPLVGCFACLTGATTTLNCRSRLHDVHVAITCNDAPRGIIKCSPRGHHTDLVLNLDSPDIDIVCFAGPEGDNATSFPIKGTLFYAPVISIHNPYNSSSFVSFVPTSPDSSFSFTSVLKPLNDLFSLLSFPFYHPYAILFLLIVFISIALIILKNRYFTISTKTE